MMSRKRRLSNTSQSSTSSPDPADPLHVSSDSTSIIDGSTSDGASSPTVRFTSPQSQNQNGVNGNHNHHLDDVVPPNKKRRRGGGPLKFQRSFEGMILGESNPPNPGLEYPLHSNTPTSSWYAVPPQQPLPSYPADTLDCRDALAPDAEGDITISNDVDVLRPQSVEQPSSMKQETILDQTLRMEDDAMDEDQPNGRLRRGKSWYEPEKDRIIITSLSDTESSPSSSPRTTPIILDLPVHPTDGIIDLDSLPASNDSTYHQPGPAGFTISPSFLSRLNKRQLESTKTYDFGFPANYQGEKGLIMYQPKPPPPFGVGNSMGRERSQNGMEDEDEERLDLGARIEEIDDLGEMDTMEGTQQQSRGEDQMDLDMDMGLVDDVESMDIG